MVLNMPPEGPSGPSTITTDGPINLGVSTGTDLLARFQPVTPSKAASTSSALTNGVHPTSPDKAAMGRSNGSSSHTGHDADAEGDTPMACQDSTPTSNEKSNETQKTHTTTSYGATDSAQPRPYHTQTAPSQQLRKEHNMAAPLSQTGALTPMPEGSQPADFQNEASTTQSTTGKRHSGFSSGERGQHSTQGSGPDLFRFEDARSPGGSEIPDTQGKYHHSLMHPAPRVHSEHQRLSPELTLYLTKEAGEPAYSQGANSHHSQSQPAPDRSSQPPPPLFDGQPSRPLLPQQQRRSTAGLEEILNKPNLVLPDEGKLGKAIAEFAHQTSGLTVEQMEQVNSVLMETLWQTRGEWDRGKVLEVLAVSFNGVMNDMQVAGQDFGPSSWGRSTQGSENV